MHSPMQPIIYPAADCPYCIETQHQDWLRSLQHAAVYAREAPAYCSGPRQRHDGEGSTKPLSAAVPFQYVEKLSCEDWRVGEAKAIACPETLAVQIAVDRPNQLSSENDHPIKAQTLPCLSYLALYDQTTPFSTGPFQESNVPRAEVVHYRFNALFLVLRSAINLYRDTANNILALEPQKKKGQDRKTGQRQTPDWSVEINRPSSPTRSPMTKQFQDITRDIKKAVVFAEQLKFTDKTPLKLFKDIREVVGRNDASKGMKECRALFDAFGAVTETLEKKFGFLTQEAWDAGFRYC